VAFGRYLLMPALPQFAQRYPEISLEVRFNDHFVDILAEGVDVAVRVGKIRSPDLIARKVTASRALTCASPKYLARAGVPRTPEELRKHRLIGHLRRDASRPSDWQFRHGPGTRAMRLPMALSFNTAEALMMSALEGQGIVQQLDILVGGYLAEGRLVEVLHDYSCEGPPMSVVYPRATQHLAKVRVFAEFAADLMRKYQASVARRPVGAG
jgi:LysR family transcriptional regulator for bpeEF and oprC